MTTARRTRCSLLLGLVASLAVAVEPAGQETLAHAKNLYILAAYDEALVVLNRLQETASAPESSEIAAYQAFCLFALGRTEDAKQADAGLVKSDPLYRPAEATTSPRTRAVFDEVREALLPDVVRDVYDRAKAALDRNEPAATAGFDRVLTLLNEPALANLQDAADLRRLAAGFRDLAGSRAIASDASAPKADAATVAATAPPPDAAETPSATPPVFTTEDAGVVPPVTVSRTAPPWYPNEIEKLREFRGLLEVVVDERGDVRSAALAKSVHPKYDAGLLEAARGWKFRPATKDGVPVPYRTTIVIRLGPGGT
jgi:TonB family protein